MTGIYCIHNTTTGDEYIGSSCDIGRRWEEHKRHLRAHRHPTGPLQDAWDTYGEESFTFSVLREVDNDEELLRCEAETMRDYKPAYNIQLMNPDTVSVGVHPSKKRPAHVNSLELTPEDVDLIADEATGIFTCLDCGQLVYIEEWNGKWQIAFVSRRQADHIKWIYLLSKKVAKMTS